MNWWGIFWASGRAVLTRPYLLGIGRTDRDFRIAVAAGEIVRLRGGQYCLPDFDPKMQEAVRVGGRATCVTALHSYGIYAIDPTRAHVHLPANAARMRSRENRRILLARTDRSDVRLHWGRLLKESDGNEFRVGVADALAQAARCVDRWQAVASFDSALHSGSIGREDLGMVFDSLPPELKQLRALIDGRSESGQESILRLHLREMGLRYEVQPTIPGVGRVDFLVENRLVLEADSQAHHSEWSAQVRDRQRDLGAAAQGLMSLRPAYQHTMFEPHRVREAIRGLLTQPRHRT